MRKENIKKKMSGIAKDIGQYGLILAIGFILLGIYGMILALGITVVAPLCMGMAGAGYQTGGTKWGDLSKGQKAGIGGFLVFLSPFILGAILWLVLTSVSYWIDAMIVIMIICLGSYFYFSRGDIKFIHTSMLFLGLSVGDNGRINKGRFANIMSSKVVLAIGVIIALALLIGTSYNTATEYPATSQNKSTNDDFLVPPGTDTQDATVALGNYTGEGGNLGDLADENLDTIDPDTLPIFTNVVFGVYDTMLRYDEWGDPVGASLAYWEQSNVGGQISLDDAELEGAYPLYKSKITITAGVVKTQYEVTDEGGNINVVNVTPPKDVTAYTDENGFATIRKLSQGIYDMKIEKTGYATLITEIEITEAFIEETKGRLLMTEREDRKWRESPDFRPDFSLTMRPRTFQITVTYSISNTTTYETYDVPIGQTQDANRTLLMDAQMLTAHPWIEELGEKEYDWPGDGYTPKNFGEFNFEKLSLASNKSRYILDTLGIADYMWYKLGSALKLDATWGTEKGWFSEKWGQADFIKAVNILLGYDEARKTLNDTVTFAIDDWEICATATISGGMRPQQMMEINRQDKYYGATGLPGLAGQTMFTLQNQMLNLQNSYFSGLQMVLPALQSITIPAYEPSGGAGEGVVHRQYKGHSISYVETAQVGGGKALVLPAPSNIGVTNNQTIDATGRVWTTSKLMLQQWNYHVITDIDTIDLTFKFKTYFDVWSSYWVAGDATEAGRYSYSSTTEDRIIESVFVFGFGDGRTIQSTNPNPTIETGHTGDTP